MILFKRGPIERLQEKKVFGPKALAALYAKVVDRTINTTIKYIRKMKKVLKFLWRCVGVLYFPIYLLAWVLHEIARLTLAIAYFGLLNKQAGKDIIKSLFKWHGRY